MSFLIYRIHPILDKILFLTNLTQLGISNNDISGTIIRDNNYIYNYDSISYPVTGIDNIGLLTSLTHLNISNIKISGTLIRDNNKSYNLESNMSYLIYSKIHPR
jgi:hypothetical protein